MQFWVKTWGIQMESSIHVWRIYSAGCRECCTCLNIFFPLLWKPSGLFSNNSETAVEKIPTFLSKIPEFWFAIKYIGLYHPICTCLLPRLLSFIYFSSSLTLFVFDVFCVTSSILLMFPERTSSINAFLLNCFDKVNLVVPPKTLVDLLEFIFGS